MIPEMSKVKENIYTNHIVPYNVMAYILHSSLLIFNANDTKTKK